MEPTKDSLKRALKAIDRHLERDLAAKNPISEEELAVAQIAYSAAKRPAASKSRRSKVAVENKNYLFPSELKIITRRLAKARLRRSINEILNKPLSAPAKSSRLVKEILESLKQFLLQS